ncbi:MAG: hypothetical protein JSR24_10245, partial [Proteobacteria bacterium]|nr:hypothetical protein [Pseudomonadota bacterium]
MKAALRRICLMAMLIVVSTGGPALAQGDPAAQQKAYTAILATPDATKRAQALELFIAYYPASPLMIPAHEQLMASWQAAQDPARSDAAATRLLQIDPGNVRALANKVFVGRARLATGDVSGLAGIVAMAERGLAALPKWPKPEGVSDQEFARLKLQATAIFDSALGFAAQHAKDYVKARRYYLDAVTLAPDNLQDVYQLAVVQLESTPLDPLGFWYAARAIALAREARSEQAATSIDRYARARYHAYHGSEEGWDPL